MTTAITSKEVESKEKSGKPVPGNTEKEFLFTGNALADKFIHMIVIRKLPPIVSIAVILIALACSFAPIYFPTNYANVVKDRTSPETFERMAAAFWTLKSQKLMDDIHIEVAK